MKKGYWIGIGIAVVVILIIVGIIADNRHHAVPANNGTLNASSSLMASTTAAAATSAALSTSTIMNMIEAAMATTTTITSANDAVLVVTPNGGETWNAGSLQTISWRVWERYLVYDPFDITMVPQKGSCIYPMQCAVNPVTIATKVATTSYGWQVGSAANLPTGNYKAEVCFSGTNVCDMSDNYFTITATATSSPACPKGYGWNGSECLVTGTPIQPN